MLVLTIKKILVQYRESKRNKLLSATDHEAIFHLDHYFKHREDNEELSDADIYKIVTWVSCDITSRFYLAIKQAFHLYPIDKACALSIASLMSIDTRNCLSRLMKSDKGSVTELNQKYYFTLLLLMNHAVNEKWSLSVIEACIHFFSHWNKLQGSAFELLMRFGHHERRLLDVLELCNHTYTPYEMFNHYCVGLLTYLDAIKGVINHLKTLGITTDKVLIGILIHKTNSSFYDQQQVKIFSSLLSQFVAAIHGKVLLDDHHWALLIDKNTVSQTGFMRLIGHLNEENLLDQKTFFRYFKLHIVKNKSLLNCPEKLSSLIEILMKHHIIPENKSLLDLFSLTLTQYAQCKTTILHLSAAGLLNKNSFHKTLDRMCERFPQVTPVEIDKDDNLPIGCPRSKVISTDGKYAFFTDHKNVAGSWRDKGSFGIVRKGYATINSTTPIVGVKKILQSARNEKDDGYHDAMREVKYNRLLKRQSDFYETWRLSGGNGYSVITEWLDGKDLSYCTSKECAALTYAERLQCLCQAFLEVNTLHQHNRIHGDLKYANFVINLQNKSMKLIDFGGAIKFGSGKNLVTTHFYEDPNNLPEHFYSDMYSMSIVTMALFPELFEDNFQGKIKVQKHDYATFTQIKVTQLSTVEKAIIQLVESLQHKDTNRRCTSEDAYRYCSELVKCMPDLDEAMLQNITVATIHRTEPTVEDILREARIKTKQ